MANNQVFDKTLYNNELIEQYEYMSIMPIIASGKFSDLVFKGTTVINESLEDFDTVAYNGTLTYSELVKLTQSVVVDQSEQVSKRIRRGDEWVSQYDLQSATRKKAAKAFAKKTDSFHLEKMRDNAGGVIDIEGEVITKDNVLAVLINPIVKAFDDNDVDTDDRYLITTSDIKLVIEDLDIYTKNDGVDGSRWSGDIKGLKVVFSNQLPANEFTPAFTDSIALQKDAYQYLNGVSTIDMGQSENFDGKYFYSVADWGGDVLAVLDKGVLKITADLVA